MERPAVAGRSVRPPAGRLIAVIGRDEIAALNPAA